MTRPPATRWTAGRRRLQSPAATLVIGAVLVFAMTLCVTTRHAQASVSSPSARPAPRDAQAVPNASPAADPAGPTNIPEADPPPADDREVIEVATVRAFVDAIGSDRILRLTGDDYLLSSFRNINTRHARVTDRGFYILGVENLTIQGHAALLTDIADVPVLTLIGCENLCLDNLELGHTAQAVKQYGACTGPVIEATDCEELTLAFCDLFGCGAVGLELSNIQALRFESSRIYGCKLGLIQATHALDMHFIDASFDNNTLDGFAMTFTNCGPVHFRDCAAYENTQSQRTSKWTEDFFNITDPAGGGEHPTRITLENSAFETFPFAQLTNRPARVREVDAEDE
ncbi:MAG: hypothetical protein ACIAXF_14585 [Phycisphaerales bacterium JB063]